MDRPVAAFVGPQAGHRDDAVVDLAARAQILAGRARGGGGGPAGARGVDYHPPRPVPATMPFAILPTEPRYWRATCAVAVPSLRSPVSSITSAPASWGVMA